MGNLIDLKKRAFEILKKEMPKAEAIVQDIQSAWESQWGDIQDDLLTERMKKCINKIENLEKSSNAGDQLKLLQEKNKLQVLIEMTQQTANDRFGNVEFDESSPNLIIDDVTAEELAESDELLSGLEDMDFED